ncbi:MAG: radical SAM protein [Planctomycetes bacterium]|nr:radical SAM protein [Planctomycetota bacterium]
MVERVRPYLFYGHTTALCAECLRTVPAKEIIEDGKVFLLKRCQHHGEQRVMLADDAAYWRLGREVFLKPPEQPARYNTPHHYGCPYDCGICPDHEQHGCLCLLEITDHCNLRCPTCYAGSGPERQTHRSLAQIERMLDCIVANEVEPDVVQISGGEPTTHPEFFAVLDACRRRPIRHLMLNTNGVRIAREDGFAEKLAAYAPRFEVYLQFDSLSAAPQHALRGADLRSVRSQALEKLNRLNLSTTLVVTVRRGLNDGELGEIIRFAAAQQCVRGVTIQPVQDAGRNDGYDSAEHRLTLSEVRRRILEQCDWFAPEDLIPVPCHPDSLAMAYALKRPSAGKPVTPLTSLIDPQVLISGGRNTIVYEGDARIRGEILKAFSTNHSPQSAAGAIARLLCCLPGLGSGFSDLGYDQVFRVIIMQFLDRHSLDLRSVRKSCVHIAHPDGKRMIPFDTYNLFYRDRLEAEVLNPLRRELNRGAVAAP